MIYIRSLGISPVLLAPRGVRNIHRGEDEFGIEPWTIHEN
jgi:hypothetical protein